MTSPTSSTAGNTLAIDTSGMRGSLALAKGAQRFAVHWEKKAMHSELATVKLGELLSAAELSLGDVRKIMVNTGPGSFTGIRVGLNLARSLGYALNLPVAGLNTLALLAFRQQTENGSIFVAIKAIQNFYYAAGYTFAPSQRPVERPAPASVLDSDLTAATKGFDQILIEGTTTDFSPQLDAATMLDWLVQRPDSITFSTWKEVSPVYIRASEAEEKLLKGLLKA